MVDQGRRLKQLETVNGRIKPAVGCESQTSGTDLVTGGVWEAVQAVHSDSEIFATAEPVLLIGPLGGQFDTIQRNLCNWIRKYLVHTTIKVFTHSGLYTARYVHPLSEASHLDARSASIPEASRASPHDALGFTI